MCKYRIRTLSALSSFFFSITSLLLMVPFSLHHKGFILLFLLQAGANAPFVHWIFIFPRTAVHNKRKAAANLLGLSYPSIPANLGLISGRQMHRINACIFLVTITKKSRNEMHSGSCKSLLFVILCILFVDLEHVQLACQLI